MGRKKDKIKSSLAAGSNNGNAFNPQIPCLMISLNSWRSISEDQPDNLRLYPGGGTPFIETVRDTVPSVFIIHNFLAKEESDYLIKSSESNFISLSKQRKGKKGVPGLDSFSSMFFHFGIWKNEITKSIEDKISTISDFPIGHFSDLEVS